MTREEILNCPEGVSLDWHIAHFVMGLPKNELTAENCECPYCHSQMRYCGKRSWCSECHTWRHSGYKEYSSEIESAWEVVIEMQKKNCQFFFAVLSSFCKARFAMPFEREILEATADINDHALAICRAALLTVLEL